MDLVLLALLVAMGALGARSVRRGWLRRRIAALRASTPGYSPDNPALLSSSQAVDDAVEAARCACGGRIANRGETPRLGQRVVRGQCLDCDADVDLYFVLPHLLN